MSNRTKSELSFALKISALFVILLVSKLSKNNSSQIVDKIDLNAENSLPMTAAAPKYGNYGTETVILTESQKNLKKIQSRWLPKGR